MRIPSAEFLSIAVLCATALCPSSALAYRLAATDGRACEADEGCEVLHWPADEPIPFRIHFSGSSEVPDLAMEAAIRLSFAAWSQVPDADIEFEELGIYVGDACPDGDFPDHETLCPTRSTDVDYEPVLFFMEEGWPFGPEVVALTTVSWSEGGEIVDADTSFNSFHHDFTWRDEDIRTDLRSIATHEFGHFLGLAHSERADATMAPEYLIGETRQRVLSEDDEEGARLLYPCEEGPCVGEVGWEKGCDQAGSASLFSVVALIALLGVRGLRRRGRALGVVALSAAVLIGTPVDSSIVLGLNPEALARDADLVVRGTVTEMESYRAGIVRTQVVVEIEESWKGLSPNTITLDQPGGRILNEGTIAFGLPSFEIGEKVVLFLHWPEGAQPRVLGLSQGKFRVGVAGRLERDLSGLAFASANSGASGKAQRTVPSHLEDLRTVVEAASR